MINGLVARSFNAIRSVKTAARRAAHYAKAEYLFQHRLRARSRFDRPMAISLSVLGDYLISTDVGVYRLCANTLQRVYPLPAFGMAANDEWLYLASWSDHDSRVVCCSKRGVLEEKRPYGGTEIYRVPLLDASGRIHQIALNGNDLWLANTARNSLTKIDRVSGEWKAEIAPFSCSFGLRISGDHNHINSVRCYGNILLFTAFRIDGKQGMLGVCGGGRLRGYAYRHDAIHDIHLKGNHLVFSDTAFYFSHNDGDDSGALIYDGQPYARDYFAENRMGFVRGVAGHQNEVVIGNSYRGPREKRFGGRGTLLVGRDGKVVESIVMPASQVYDIIRTDGDNFDERPAPKDYNSVCGLLSRHFGEPVLKRDLDELLVHKPGTKPWQNIRGSVAEFK